MLCSVSAVMGVEIADGSSVLFGWRQLGGAAV